MSTQSIYSKGGWPVGWLSTDVIYDLTGDARAFVAEGSVCSFEGQRLGAFGDGYLRDPSGDAVGYVEGAKGGPALPEIQATESAPEFNEEPERPSTSGAASGAPESDGWSELAFNTLMRGWPPGVTDING
jgi:hypothetical protein